MSLDGADGGGSGLREAWRAVRRRLRPTCFVCAIVRDEAPYLREWAAFHLAVGFDRIVVYDNESTDGGPALFARGRWPRRVSVVPWPSTPGQAPQLAAYADFFRRFGRRCDWVAILDADEFLNLKHHDHVAAFVAMRPRADAIAVNWRMFGSAGLEGTGDGLVVERFTRASRPDFPANGLVKSLMRPEAVLHVGHHSPALHPGRRLRAPDGRPLDAGPMQERVDYAVAQVNHYFTKSRDEFAAKRARGRGDMAPDDPARHRPASEFDAYDRNEEEDTTILRWRPALRHMLRRMDGG